MEEKCTYCKGNTRKSKKAYRGRRMLSGDAYQWHRHYLTNSCQMDGVSETSFLCAKCRMKLDRIKLADASALSSEVDIEMMSDDNENCHPDSDTALKTGVTLNVERAGKTHAQCVICRAKIEKGGSRVIPIEARFDLLVRFNVWSDHESRICSCHMTGNHLLGTVERSSNEKDPQLVLTSDQATEIIEGFLAVARKKENSFSLDINDPYFSDADCLVWTGWTKAQFQTMLACLENTSDSSQRDKSTALLIFWVKLKTGLSFLQIASLLNKNNDAGKKMVSRAFRTVAADLDKHFAPSFLGCGHITREKSADHMTAYSSVLYGGKLCIIWDGTYYYIEKSGTYSFSRHTYSGQKHRPLVKFMSIVFPDGYVLESIGPYLADGKNNDAGITQHILGLHGDLTDWLSEGDVCIVDRGFRDVLDVFEDLGLETKMPSFLRKGLSQHTVEEANQSRLVTKVRWAVEAYHGRIKKWLFFDKVILHDFIDIVGPLNRILTAAINAFRPPLVCTDESDAEMAREMLRKAECQRNALFGKIEKGPFSSRGKWLSLDAQEAIPDFSVLSKAQLQMLTFGTYQLKQAKSYTSEHLSEDGDYNINVHNQAPGLLRVRIQSRHINAKRYFCWVEYNTANIDDKIVAWFCQCLAGQRTVGCCAHVASILWYLGNERHNNNRRPLQAKKCSVINAADR